MKTKNILWAALSMTAALVMTACSSNDDIVTETPQPQAPSTTKTIPYTVTVGGGENTTRATVDSDNRTLQFAEGDKLYITGISISGVLDLKAGDEGKANDATFSGTLTYRGEGSPAEDHVLEATLVSAQQNEDVEVLINSTTKAVMVQYPEDTYCESINAAVQKYSALRGTSTFGAKSFMLTQETAFLNFVITFEDGTAAGETLSAVVSNNGSPVCTANVTTVTESDKVVTKFVLPVEGGTMLDQATLKLGTKAVIPIPHAFLSPKVYNVKRTQQAKLAAEAAAEDLHKFIGDNGRIYETQAAATRAGVTTVARIFYVGNDAETNDTYNHGLALALTDANNSESAVWCSLDYNFWNDEYTCLSLQYHDRSDAIGDMAGIANTDALINLHGTEVTVTTIIYDQPTITKPHNHQAAVAARNFNPNRSLEVQ